MGSEISGTGWQPVGRQGFERGFTLLEILVVLVLMGIMIGLVSVNLMPNDRHTLDEEAARLAALFNQAQEEAMLSGRVLGWELRPDGYRFVQEERAPGRDGAAGKVNWVPVSGNDILRPRQWPDGVQVLAFKVNDAALTDKEPLLLNPVGLSPPFELTIGLNNARVRLDGNGKRVVVRKDGA